jgi:hypothetical protein
MELPLTIYGLGGGKKNSNPQETCVKTTELKPTGDLHKD